MSDVPPFSSYAFWPEGKNRWHWAAHAQGPRGSHRTEGHAKTKIKAERQAFVAREDAKQQTT